MEKDYGSYAKRRIWFKKRSLRYSTVSQSTIGKYESNQRTPAPDAIIKLAVFFDVSTDYLLGHSDIRNPEKPDYYNLPEEAIRQIEEFKEFIKGKYRN